MIKNPIKWPNGAKCAACLTFDMDADSLIHLTHPVDGHKRVSALSMLQYGPQVGVPRILDSYKRLGIRQTFFIPAWCIERYPEAVTSILEHGHEIGHHGYLHENPVAQSREEQAYWLDLGIEIIKKATGVDPRGWRAPLYNFSNDSLDLLLSRGFTYDTSLMGDDVPYLLESRETAKRLVELPVHWGIDDWPQFVQSFDLDYMMPIRSPRSGFETFAQEFEAAYKYGGIWTPVLHPFVVGRPARWDVFEEFVENALKHGDVWFAPMEEIAAYVETAHREQRYAARVDVIPQYARPVARVTFPPAGKNN
ncbi:polysaccharide deacetylase [Paraburkholderia sp. BL10I2N1]|uniref:polysaccharide deacetylase family protein n=1 Tax=Paraburkholderia sp. BL10I2N1 TaxID=1938796 RepID=UPI001061D7FD|nr:polysaccharide deacetylase [Paraburkholderia sp. BL10I2N1]TDN58711.1 polysaccharide deacetylase [Paraburkholderia sp. BL10I2N1]